MITEVSTAVTPSERLDALDWGQLAGDLNELGCALTGPVLSPAECGWSAAPVRHGVSVIPSGKRRTLGLVLHDAT